eukprot:CAMPEP_0182459022 /NCGR_PEP_ID=MMETSP1319-20130603/4248_1 /TAXON_ID=172717 /ORGANISM="Bolidomonas pacifica, Strain RCC208" /LENGTH=39 /DNA_ID= /DNA_START= /DNA_END= /DNA_ORIENTATION=
MKIYLAFLALANASADSGSLTKNVALTSASADSGSLTKN